MADEPNNSAARTERRLAAILAADISGYSALMGADEDATVRDLKGHQSVILPLIATNGGRVIDTAGDGILAEFSSILNAVTCAMIIQDVMERRNAKVDPARRMQFRIGINQGDVISDGIKLYGDGVNIAARLETICDAGGICISAKVHDEISGKIDVQCEDVGAHKLKNIAAPIRAYKLLLGARSADAATAPPSTPVARRTAARQLQAAIAQSGLSAGKLAELTGLGRAAIDQALAGDGTQATRTLIENVLAAHTQGASAEPQQAPPADPAPASGAAPIDIGGYTRTATDHFIGRYLTVRPSFSGNGTIYCYTTRISWSDRDSCLIFEEQDRPEKQFQHTGKIYIPPSSMFIHLVSLTKGAMRTVLVSQMGQTQEMRGLITTLANDTGAMFIPACAPIVYQKRPDLSGLQFGHLTPDDEGYASYRTLLQDTVRKSFVRLVGAT